MTKIKICGISDVAAGVAAIDAGAELLGFVFYPPSPRALEAGTATGLIDALRAARPAGWKAVGVFVNEPLSTIEHTLRACALDVVQLNGDETAPYIRQVPAPVFKAVRLGGAFPTGTYPTAESLGAERILVDASVPGRYGGTGVTYPWGLFRPVLAEGLLAGGLTPENVAQAIKAARPWGVDVSSGVERAGEKSPDLIQAFAEAVRLVDEARARP